MSNPLANIPCPIRLATQAVPTAQSVSMEGEVVKALLVSGVENVSQTSGLKTGAWTENGSSFILLPPGSNVADVRPGSQVTANNGGFAEGTFVDTVYEGMSVPGCSSTKDSPVVFLSPLAPGGLPPVGARAFGRGFQKGTVVAATSDEPRSVRLGISSSFDKVLVPDQTEGLIPGMVVTAANVLPGTVVTEVTDAALRLDVAATADGNNLPAVFANLPVAVGTNGTFGGGSRSVTVQDTTGIVAGMWVSGAGIPAGAMVLKVTASSKVIDLNLAATAAGNAVPLVFTTPTAQVSAHLSNPMVTPAYTEVLPDSSVEVPVGGRMYRSVTDFGNTVRQVQDNGVVVVDGIVPATSGSLPTVFTETQRVCKMMIATKGSYKLTPAPGSSTQSLQVGMVAVGETDAALVPQGAVVVEVTSSYVQLSLPLAKGGTAAFAIGFYSPTSDAVVAQGTGTVGVAHHTTLRVEASANVDRLRKGMALTPSGLNVPVKINGFGETTSAGREVIVSEVLEANATKVTGQFADAVTTVQTVTQAAVVKGPTVVVKPAAGLKVNMVVTGGGLPLGAVIKAIAVSGTTATLTLDQTLYNIPANASVTFTQPYAELQTKATRFEGTPVATVLHLTANADKVKKDMTVLLPNNLGTAKVAGLDPVTHDVYLDRDLPTANLGNLGNVDFRDIVTTTLTVAAGKDVATLGSMVGVTVGMKVSAPGLPGDTTVTSLNSNSVKLSAAPAQALSAASADFENASARVTSAASLVRRIDPTTVVTVLDSHGLELGMQLVGNNVPANSKIVSIVGDQVLINQTAHRTTAPVTFGKPWLPVTVAATGTQLTLPTTAGTPVVVKGMAVDGAVIPAGTVVSAVTGNLVTLSKAVSQASSSTGVRFRDASKDVVAQTSTLLVSPASSTLTVASATGVQVGMKVASGGTLPESARVVSVAGNVLKLNVAVDSMANLPLLFTKVVDTSMTNVLGTNVTVLTAEGVEVDMIASGTGIPFGAKVKAVNGQVITLDKSVAANPQPVAVVFEETTGVTTTGDVSGGTPAKYQLKFEGAATAVLAAYGGVSEGMTVSGDGIPDHVTVKQMRQEVLYTGETQYLADVESPVGLRQAKAGETVVFLDMPRSISASYTNDKGVEDLTVLSLSPGFTGQITTDMELAATDVTPGGIVVAVNGLTVKVQANLKAISTAQTLVFHSPSGRWAVTSTNPMGVGDSTRMEAQGVPSSSLPNLVPGMMVGLAADKLVTVKKVEAKDATTRYVTLDTKLTTAPSTDVLCVQPLSTVSAAIASVKDSTLTLSANATGIYPGMGVLAAGLPAGAMVMSVSAKVVTLNISTTGVAAGSVTFVSPTGTPISVTASFGGHDTVVYTSTPGGIAPGMAVAAIGLPLRARVTQLLPPSLKISNALITNGDMTTAEFSLVTARRTAMQATVIKGNKVIKVPSNRGLLPNQIIAAGGALMGVVESIDPDGEKVYLKAAWPDPNTDPSAPRVEETVDASFGAVISLSKSPTLSFDSTVFSAGPVIKMAGLTDQDSTNAAFSFKIQARTLADVQEGDYCIVAVQLQSISGDIAWLMAYGYVRGMSAGMRQFYLWGSETGGSPVKEMTVPPGVNNLFWGYGPGPHTVAVFQKPRLSLASGRARSLLSLPVLPKLQRLRPIDPGRSISRLEMKTAPHLAPVTTREYVSAAQHSIMEMVPPVLGWLNPNLQLATRKVELVLPPPALSDSQLGLLSGNAGIANGEPAVLRGAENIHPSGRSEMRVPRPVMQYGTGTMLLLDKEATETRDGVMLTFTPTTPPETWIYNGRVRRTASLTQGSAVVIVPEGVLDLVVGMPVTGEGIPSDAKILLVPSSTLSATVRMRAWASAAILIEGQGLSVRDVARDCLAVWNLRGASTATLPEELRDRVISDINAAMQLIHSRARELDYFNLATYELEVGKGRDNVTVPADVQQVVGNVRLGGGGPPTPLWALRSMAELEQFGPCYLGTAPGTQGPPQAYFIDRRALPEWNSVGMAVYVAPAPEKPVVLEVDVALAPPRFHWDDVLKATPLRLPHAFAETLLIPIVRQRATTYKLFTNDSLKPGIEDQYQKAMEALGLVDPAPKQASVLAGK